MLSVFAGKVQDAPVEGDEYKSVMNREAEQIRIGDLIMTEKPFGEWFAQRAPVGGDRLIVIARQLRQSSQHCGRLLHAQAAGARSYHMAQETCLAEWAESPFQMRRSEPANGGRMVDVLFVQNRHQDIHVEQMPDGPRQGRPPRTT
jgi:hypothetical protein